MPNAFQVQIGNVMMITNLIPTTIQWEFENRFTVDGYPVAALMKLNLISFTIPAQADMLAFFTHQTGLLTDTPAAPMGGALPAAGG